MSTKTSFLFLLALALIGQGVRSAQAAGPAQRPNIVYFLVDDLGWADVGYHGSDIRTPAIDRLAASGAKLDSFYAQPVCSPTRAALMTGRYPIRYGLQTGVIRPWASYGLSLKERTMADILRASGYRTLLLGKWHLGHFAREYLPLQRGFEYHYGHYNGAIDYFTHEREGGLDWHRNGKAVREEGYTTELIARDAVSLVEKHDQSRPLFLCVTFNAPHGPFEVPEKYTAPYRHRKGNSRIYAGMVAAVDDAIGRILEAFRKRGLMDNTIFVFSSDNGGPSPGKITNNGPWRGAKGTLYEGGVRVAACVSWKGRIPAGTVVNEPLHMVDWLPTFARLAGASLEGLPALDGLDAWKTLAEKGPSPHECILLNAEPSRVKSGGRGAVRAGRWKLILHGDPSGSGKGAQLFDLSADPGETTDVAAGNPEIVARLSGSLREFADAAVEPLVAGDHMPADFHVPKV
ncbi:MAG: arylsulfatase, partial [Opitutaceae bacterium]|nr:arylsulfatase [Opitutaceae bacterium]